MPDVDHDQCDWDQSLLTEFRRLAGAAMAGERPDHTLQPTALVNEAYLVLNRQRNIDIHDRSQFLAAASTTIRRILVDHARKRNAEKRGGLAGKRIPLHVSLAGYANDVDVLSINDALDALAKNSERAARVVELRFFGGMTGEEIADTLGVSLRTVNNDWAFSKAWLYREMAGKGGE